MSINASHRQTLALLSLAHAPVALAFMDEPPAGVSRVGRAEAAGCGYWRLAAAGRSFYTAADDHGNCPIGAFTHGVQLSPDKVKELEGLVGTMVQLNYIRNEEVPSIPRRHEPMRVVVYAPLAEATFAPDVVLFRGTARQIMLMSEAARSAGVFATNAVLGRPACAMIPQAIAARSGVASIGCIGNRVYTELGDDELYLAVPGGGLHQVLDALATILTANVELEKFHRARAAALAG